MLHSPIHSSYLCHPKGTSLGLLFFFFCVFQLRQQQQQIKKWNGRKETRAQI